MAELDTDRNVVAMVGRRDLLQALDVVVEVDSEAAGRDSAVARHAGRFGDCAADTAQRKAAVMLEMPRRDVPVIGAVLAHRRHDDAVAEGQFAQGKRPEQGR